MAKPKDGSGYIYQRGNVWWVKVYINGQPHRESSKSEKKEDAKRLRDKLLGQKHRGELSGGHPDRVTVGELLDNFLAESDANVRPSTAAIYKLVTEANLRPFFGKLRACKVTTDTLREYRRKRLAEGRSDATANRELALLRIAYRQGQKCTPPKVIIVPHFPMVQENNVRTGFLTDEQYTKLLAELPTELKPLFATAYATGIRYGELLAIRWPQVDFTEGFITLENGETKNGEGRIVPILEGDMHELLSAARKERDEQWPESQWVFTRQGEPIKDIRRSWEQACTRAGVPDLNFHDLRRTAVRNMRRDGVPQVVRMKISGHKTDSMERRYNIVDADDIKIAKSLMQAGRRNPSGRPA
jgi:integrase